MNLPFIFFSQGTELPEGLYNLQKEYIICIFCVFSITSNLTFETRKSVELCMSDTGLGESLIKFAIAL